MAIHIIPDGEEEQHEEDHACKCEPDLHMDTESGEITWIHQILDWSRMFVGFFKI